MTEISRLAEKALQMTETLTQRERAWIARALLDDLTRDGSPLPKPHAEPYSVEENQQRRTGSGGNPLGEDAKTSSRSSECEHSYAIHYFKRNAGSINPVYRCQECGKELECLPEERSELGSSAL